MGFFIAMFLCNLLMPSIMVIAGYCMYKNPPKEINGLIEMCIRDRTNTEQKEQQLKKLSKMSLIRSLLPVVGLVVIFLLFNVLTNFRMVGNCLLYTSRCV